jgi:hypothetical protein
VRNGDDVVSITNSTFTYINVVSTKEEEHGGMVRFVGGDTSAKLLMSHSVFRNITTRGVVGGVVSIRGECGGVGVLCFL